MMMRFVGPAVAVLALSLALVACTEVPGTSSTGTASSGAQSGTDASSNNLGFDPSKLGGGGGGGY
jgi:ABC-type oligopeptide transport system substrate-binding subunit